ncbi:Butyrophilin subfamily 1 member A1 [Tupaia chinensis]|uniref:Butyrophilin subfamily 1 member A1 n=1 Tax=Tupaia chinensis TaxID=246437 RepID=L8YCU7_TUPCH|nr:Butyrophilin subfamily 1 member A1 [Tupaia chinensis]
MEGCCSCSWLLLLPSLLLLVQLPPGGATDEFAVIGPLDPVVAVLGADATLPCSLIPPMSAVTMELLWYRTEFSEVVLSFRDQQEQEEEQMAQYAGRTSLVRDFLAQGEAAVRIHNVRVSDDGLYTCFFSKGGFYEEANLELQVADPGLEPQLVMWESWDLNCSQPCGSPVFLTTTPPPGPQSMGEKLLALSETHAQDPEGLFHVEAALVVRDSSAGNVTCSILNPVLGQERTTAIFIPEPFFPQASPWKPAFVVSLTVLGLLLCGPGCFLKREHSAKLQEQQEREKLRSEKEEA